MCRNISATRLLYGMVRPKGRMDFVPFCSFSYSRATKIFIESSSTGILQYPRGEWENTLGAIEAVDGAAPDWK